MVKNRLCRAVSALLLTAAILAGGVSAAAADGRISGAVSVSGGHTAVIKEDGTLWVWGNNDRGQVGDGSRTARLQPVFVLTSVAAVAAGGSHTLALKTDGSLWAWGSNAYGQLGDNTKTDRLKPVRIMESAIAVAAGENHSLAIKQDGTLWAWGMGSSGQIGDGVRADRYAPVKITDSVMFVTAGDNHSLAVKSGGALYTWGANAYGQLGDGTRMDRLSPVKILENAASASAGGAHTLALKADGTLYVWGANTYGQLGDGTRGDRLTPVKIMEEVKETATGSGMPLLAGEENLLVNLSAGAHSLALKTDGTLWAWGANTYGQLGDASRGERLKPVQITTGVREISAGGDASAAVKTDGTLYLWGFNNYGQIGDGTRLDRLTPTKVLTGVKTTDSGLGAPPDKTAAAATPASASVLVNGSAVTFDAYYINGNNYFKLRDLAYALRNTSKRFAVDFYPAQSIVALTSGGQYAAVGGELSPGDGKAREVSPSSHLVYLNGAQISPLGYNIGGNNYFKLRDVARLFDFGVGWDGAREIITIDTGAGYTE
ncbi:MAG: hypothetical protein LBT12_05115 [Oscillospiraceae bacterium]|jgi:alpha-tubulin suppressor-like RCC1 family protein|nr:hypothetical protein [Oscillospiraceae bacterium]